MDAIFMNTENSKTSERHILILNLKKRCKKCCFIKS